MIHQSVNYLYSRDNIGAYAQVFQRCHQELTSIVTIQPMVVVVVRGTKRIRSGSQTVEIQRNEIAVIPENQVIDVTNLVDDKGLYQSYWFSFSHYILMDFFKNHHASKQTCLKTVDVIQNISPAFMQASQYTASSFESATVLPDTILQYRVTELLLWLAQSQIYFSTGAEGSLGLRIREIVGEKPDKKWCTEEIAHHVAMSEATLRRHLATENTSLTKLITDIRMNHGLTLLQSTSWTVERIAQEAGYESASRFAIRFRQRFGISPAKIRG